MFPMVSGVFWALSGLFPRESLDFRVVCHVWTIFARLLGVSNLRSTIPFSEMLGGRRGQTVFFSFMFSLVHFFIIFPEAFMSGVYSECVWWKRGDALGFSFFDFFTIFFT